MHGELLSAWCTMCDERAAWSDALASFPPCPSCTATALRPDIVWFGELPYWMDESEGLLREADVFVSIGTSAEVYPAAGFSGAAATFGAPPGELTRRRRR